MNNDPNETPELPEDDVQFTSDSGVVVSTSTDEPVNESEVNGSE